jgi:hypothetical protein
VRETEVVPREACYVTTQHSSMMYSTSNRKYYDTNARNFAVTINGFMSLTSYFEYSKCVTAVKVSNFTGQYLPNRSTLDIGILGFFGIV